MARALCFVLAVLGLLPNALARRGLASSSDRDAAAEAEDGEKSPVKRVVLLLGKMKAELMAEADKESGMYDKMTCWCETNEKEKTQAIADAEAKDLELSSETETRSALAGKQVVTIAALKKQIAADTETLEQATAIREKEAGEFSSEEKDMVQAVNNLRNAIAVLAKHNGGASLLQSKTPVTAGLRVLLQDVALKYELLLAGKASRRPRPPAGLLQTDGSLRAGGAEQGLHEALTGALSLRGSADGPGTLPLNLAERLVEESAHAAGGATGSFVQAGEQQPIDAAYKSYSSRSRKIFGVLNEMLEEFSAQLSDLQKTELKAIEDYQALAKAKREQIAIAKEKLDTVEGEHATNVKALSDAKEDLDLTRKQRSADVEFMQNLKVTCIDLDREWQRRSETRAEELKAVTEAIAILTEDDNREMLAKSVSFLQEAESNEGSAAAARRVRLVELLRRAAAAPEFETDDLLAAWHGRGGRAAAAAPALGAAAGPRAQLSALATSAQLDSFEEVKEMMDKMLAELKEQQKEEADFKAYCNKEFDENEKATYDKTERKGDLEAKMASLAALMDKLSKEIAEAQAQISATQVEVKKASEAREADNAEFQTVVSDQRASQGILKKALQRLKDYYSKGIGKKVIYLQRSTQTPPVKFTDYKDNAGSVSVTGLLEQIIGDSEQLDKEAMTAEAKAQAQYEQFVKDSNSLIAELSASVTAKTKASAAAKIEASEADSDHKSTVGELESLAAYEADLHGQCDFVLKNFEIRQKARLQEMEAIQAAKAFLSGQQAL